MSDEAVGCPFCGSGASVDYDKTYRHSIGCGNDGCPFQPWNDGFRSPEEAIAAWNRRAPVQTVPGLAIAQWGAQTEPAHVTASRKGSLTTAPVQPEQPDAAKSVQAPVAEVKACREWCGTRWDTHLDIDHQCDPHVTDGHASRCFCTPACRDARAKGGG